MRFLSAATPLAIYNSGDTARATEIARQVLARDPNAAEAHLALAIMRLRDGDTAGMIESLRSCVRVRSADWLLERLRDDFMRKGAPTVGQAHAFRIGAFLRSQLSPLGPALPPGERRADHEFINVVGTSYVRSFGASTAIFPLFIGMGPTMLLLTEEASALSRRKFAENLKRVDPSRDTMLVVGGDAFYHHRNLLKTRRDESEQPTPYDRELMKQVAERHGPMFADARKLLKGRIFMLGSTPTFNAFVDELALDLNAFLEPVCQAHGVELIDCWAELADPATNRLRADYSANAYPGDIHYSLATTPIFLDALKAKGALSAAVPSVADYDWSSVFQCHVDPAEPTRIWCEPSVSPNNAFKSDKIAATHLAGSLSDLLAFLLSAAPGRDVAMVNVRDGAAVTLTPPQLHSGGVALTDCEQNRRAAQMVLDFYGRTDMQLHTYGDAALDAIAGVPFWALVLMAHPDSAAADEARSNEVLKRIGPCNRLLIATPEPERVKNLALNGRKLSGPIAVSNHHLPEKWRNYSLFLTG